MTNNSEPNTSNNIFNISNIKNFSLLNLFYSFINLKIPFYKSNNFKPINPAKKYIENYKKSIQYKKIPTLYTNPKWDPVKKKLIFNSFDYELELAKKRPNITNPYFPTHAPFYSRVLENKNMNKKFPLVFTNPKWDPIKKKLVFDSLDYLLEKSGYFKK
jgi:hypothetical protein